MLTPIDPEQTPVLELDELFCLQQRKLKIMDRAPSTYKKPMVFTDY